MTSIRLASWLPGLRLLHTYQRDWPRSDVVAGLSVAAVAMPIGIAYAACRIALSIIVGQLGTLLGFKVLRRILPDSRRVISQLKGLFGVMLERSGVAERIGAAHLFPTVHDGAFALQRRQTAEPVPR